MKNSTQRNPTPVQWNAQMVTDFWSMVAQTPMDDLSFSKIIGSQLVQFIKAHVPSSARILDFGAGSGHLAALLLDAGYSVGIYEPSPERVSSALAEPLAQHRNFLGVHSSGEAAEFDAVLCFEVLEHVLQEDMQSAMQALRGFTGNKSLVLGSVPWQETLDYSLCVCPVCASLFHRWQHLRSFSQKTLEEHLNKHGFPFVKHDVDWNVFSIFFVAGQRTIDFHMDMFTTQKREPEYA